MRVWIRGPYWHSWTFGVGIDWSLAWKYCIVDIGPFEIYIEWGERGE